MADSSLRPITFRNAVLELGRGHVGVGAAFGGKLFWELRYQHHDFVVNCALRTRQWQWAHLTMSRLSQRPEYECMLLVPDASQLLKFPCVATDLMVREVWSWLVRQNQSSLEVKTRCLAKLREAAVLAMAAKRQESANTDIDIGGRWHPWRLAVTPAGL
eukprot:15467245-Alexandrium_andersonii.AAC.1